MKVNITQISPNNWNGAKYQIIVFGPRDRIIKTEYAMTIRGAKHLARKIARNENKNNFESVLIMEYEL